MKYVYKFIDWIISFIIKKEADGRTTFQAYGRFSKQYELDVDTEARLRAFLRKLYLIAAPIIIISSIFLKDYTYVIAIPLAIIYYKNVFSIVDNNINVKGKFDVKKIVTHLLDEFDIRGLMIGAVINLLLVFQNLSKAFGGDHNPIIAVIVAIIWIITLVKFFLEIKDYYADAKDAKDYWKERREIKKTLKERENSEKQSTLQNNTEKTNEISTESSNDNSNLAK